MSISEFLGPFIKGLLFLFFAIISNFLGNTMNCSMQKALMNSAIGRNIIIYFLIYFTINFTSVQVNPGITFLYALGTYILFLLMVKQNIYVFLINLSILFTIYIISQFKEYYSTDKNTDKKDSQEKTTNALDIVNYILIIILLVILVVGFIIYGMQQLEEHGADFSWLTFLFGGNQCDSLNPLKTYEPLNNPLNNSLKNPLNNSLKNPLNNSLKNSLKNPLNNSLKNTLNNSLKNPQIGGVV